jgi:hypothetical protein
MNVWTGITLLLIAGVLIWVGLPNKQGLHPRFLRFNAAMMLYPPLILVFVALGAAAVISGLAK